MIGTKRNFTKSLKKTSFSSDGAPPTEEVPWDDAPPEYDDNLAEQEEGEEEEMIKDVAPAPAPVATPATQPRLGLSRGSKGIFDEIDAELFAAVPTVEDRRFRDIYWAVYRLMRRDVRNKWYSETKNLSSMPSDLPAYSAFSPAGELVFCSEEFRAKFEQKFGTVEVPKYTAQDFLSLAKRFWKEGRDETTLVNWLKEDYKNYQQARNQVAGSGGAVTFNAFKQAFGGHEVDGDF